MNNDFYTIEEMAARLDVSARHIQYLCKQGKIEGAVKRAGVWFLPGNAEIPLKNSKSGAKQFRFAGTKKKIFENAAVLFMQRGYENVSMRDIAETVGIGQSAMYNHFKSKEEILNTIYDFAVHFFCQDRPTLDSLEPVLRHGSLLDIIASCHYEFNEAYRSVLQDITKILILRAPIDDRARQITKSLIIDEGLRYVEAVFERAVDLKRLAPFDVRSMAVFVNSMRVFFLLNWMLNDTEESLVKVNREETELFKHATRLLTDLMPNTPAE